MQPDRKQEGFTLLEMMMVLLIMALISGVVIATRPIAPAELRFQVRIAELAKSASLARYKAVKNGIAVNWNSNSEPCEDGQRDIVFFPDGTNSSGPICLVINNRATKFRLDAITGQVRF